MFSNPVFIRETWDNYTPQDHEIWAHLYRRQEDVLKNRAAPEYLEALKTLQINGDRIPKFDEINALLKPLTGFEVVAVDGLLRDDFFFTLLAQRKFPATCFIRTWEQLDYLQEPDVFHDAYGHVPLLANPIFADFTQAFGEAGLKAIDLGLLKYAARLYWFTIEFGLIQTVAGLRIYGSGIVSSKGESIYCLEDPTPVRLPFDTMRVLKTDYHIDSYQLTYFVINSYQQLFDAVKALDWAEVKDYLLSEPDFAQGVA